MFSKIIKLNAKIQHGNNRVSWIQGTLAGSSVVGILMHFVAPAAAVPGTLTIFECSAAVYYLIEGVHERHEKKR